MDSIRTLLPSLFPETDTNMQQAIEYKNLYPIISNCIPFPANQELREHNKKRKFTPQTSPDAQGEKQTEKQHKEQKINDQVELSGDSDLNFASTSTDLVKIPVPSKEPREEEESDLPFYISKAVLTQVSPLYREQLIDDHSSIWRKDDNNLLHPEAIAFVIDFMNYLYNPILPLNSSLVKKDPQVVEDIFILCSRLQIDTSALEIFPIIFHLPLFSNETLANAWIQVAVRSCCQNKAELTEVFEFIYALSQQNYSSIEIEQTVFRNLKYITEILLKDRAYQSSEEANAAFRLIFLFCLFEVEHFLPMERNEQKELYHLLCYPSITLFSEGINYKEEENLLKRIQIEAINFLAKGQTYDPIFTQCPFVIAAVIYSLTNRNYYSFIEVNNRLGIFASLDLLFISHEFEDLIFLIQTWAYLDLKSSGEIDLIIERLNDIQQRTPYKLFINQIKAYIYLRSKPDYEAALASCNEYLQINPFNPVLLIYRARCYQEMRNFELAIEDFNQAESIKPLGPYDLINRGRCHDELFRKNGDVVAKKRANLDYDKAGSMTHDENIFILAAQGEFYKRIGDRARAIACYEKAENFIQPSRVLPNLTFLDCWDRLEKNPRDSEALIQRAYFYTRNSLHREAIDDFNRAELIHPLDPYMLIDRAFCRIKLSSTKGAQEDYDKAVELTQGRDPFIISQRAKFHYEMGDYDSAIQDYEKAILSTKYFLGCNDFSFIYSMLEPFNPF